MNCHNARFAHPPVYASMLGVRVSIALLLTACQGCVSQIPSMGLHNVL